MNKTALSPTEMLLYSTLAGGGTFGLAKLMQDMGRATRKEDTSSAQRNALQIDLPTPPQQTGMPKFSSEKQAIDESILKALAAVGGAPLGFMGAKSMYDTYQKSTMQHELDKVHKQYALALQQAQATPKLAEATPLTDAACEAAAEILEKSAAGEDWKAQAFTMSDTANSLIPQSFINAGLGVAGVSGLGTLGMLIAANNKKRRDEENHQFPDQVQLNTFPGVEQGAGPITSQ